jgi:hypothetical protein
MNVRRVLPALLALLPACAGRDHPQLEGCYALVPVRPAGVIRDECQLLANVASNLSGELVVRGNVVSLKFRFATPGQGTLLDVSMAGQFNYAQQTFSADGTAANILLPIAGLTCQLQLVDVHLDATTNPSDDQRFSGVIRISTSTPRPEACICQAWFEYQAVLSSNPQTCS